MTFQLDRAGKTAARQWRSKEQVGLPGPLLSAQLLGLGVNSAPELPGYKSSLQMGDGLGGWTDLNYTEESQHHLLLSEVYLESRSGQGSIKFEDLRVLLSPDLCMPTFLI